MKKGLFKLLAVFISATLLIGCAVSVDWGRWPNIDNLSKLRLGESTGEEIRQLMGEPTGTGEGRMPDFPDVATVWSYEYQGGTTSAMEVNLLLVFLKDNIYQGHFWFVADEAVQFGESSIK